MSADIVMEQAIQKIEELRAERDTAKQQVLDYAQALHAEQRKCPEAITHLQTVMEVMNANSEHCGISEAASCPVCIVLNQVTKFLEGKDD